MVILLEQPEDESGAIKLHVAKQRNGPLGCVTLSFNAAKMQVDNYVPTVNFSSSGDGHARTAAR